MENTIMISKTLLESLLTCLIQLRAVNPQQTPEQQKLNSVSGQVLDNAGRLLIQTNADPQSFADKEVFNHAIDGTKSPYL